CARRAPTWGYYDDDYDNYYTDVYFDYW
nr:immunoglobulin heavy chain junction region [Macaca mulatta]MOV38502.1 immunoglobulin heavy chain junction region [Macaca mulatta]MOV39363.1 immunoglobulin heavy chain junction region [Macaca mulatta]MOV39387.1 immunoglobulin heavy chain junction region [Macaca mulatta]MOV39764.1 immunoglobulin heavy chain junction region [Macaca mulatta]